MQNHSEDRAALGLSRDMSVQDFAAYGVQQMAYVKVVRDQAGQPVASVHGADGTPLTVVPTRETAFALIRQNDLEPVSAH